MPLWSVGGRQSQRGAVLSQAKSDPLLTPCWAPSSPLGSSVCCRVRQAMGLFAGFAVADLKPICGEKIGLIYHPLFIVHIPFVNPKLHSLFSLWLSLLPTHMHTKQQSKYLLQWESNTAVNTGTARVGSKMLITVGAQTKELLFHQKAMATEQLEEDHMV